MSFALQLQEFADQFKADADTVVQKVAIDVLNEVIDRSPVGNPELWAANAEATHYNNEVKRYNAEARNNPDNLTKNGRLKPGRLLKDGMDLAAGKDYVGGRFRGNWQVTVDQPASGTLDRIDPNGGETKAAGAAVIAAQKAGGTIWIANNLPYGPRLEFESWSKQAPAGMVRITVTRAQEFVDSAVASVKE